MIKVEKTAFYRQLVFYASKGFEALDESSQQELKQFTRSQVHSSGGFADRGGTPDPYYTLFGTWLAGVAQLQELYPAIRSYLLNMRTTGQWNLVNRCCQLIAGQETGFSRRQRLGLAANLLKSPRTDIAELSRSYQYFLVFLALDALGLNNRLSRMVIRPIVKNAGLISDAPCPVQAASLLLKVKLGLNTRTEQQLLLHFFEEGQGFKAFPDAPGADLLSTAVALTALKFARHDLRTLKPACLSLVEHCYSDGAFTAGNGDLFRDTEYTFYGLLALGMLA